MACRRRLSPLLRNHRRGSLRASKHLITGEAVTEAFAPPRRAPTSPWSRSKLPPVTGTMEADGLHVGPEAGWGPSSKPSSTRPTERLTVAMYQFTAPLSLRLINAAVDRLERRTFGTGASPDPGDARRRPDVKADDLDEDHRRAAGLREAIGSRFELAWSDASLAGTHPNSLWASAYHIKVAVRDGNAAWVSSGNWQSSNQPNVHPFDGGDLPTGFQRKYNRDYHAIFKNARIASIFEEYVKRDHDLSAAQAGGAAPFSAPDLFVPEEAEAAMLVRRPRRSS